MPLSPADIQFLKRQINARLVNARWWPFTRVTLLLFSAIFIGTGCANWMLAPKMSQAFAELLTMPHSAATRLASSPAGTQPLTRGEFYRDQEFQDAMIVAQPNFTAGTLALQLTAMAQWTLGSFFIVATLAKWNRHRRDIILITLLRDKCPELA